MSSLRELQQRVYRAIVLEDDRQLAARSDAGVRLEVYRNNARVTFRRTLAATYPVVRALVGDACFRSLARDYMRDFPSRSGDLAAFGAEFPLLLGVYYRDTSFAYLEDVARLELAIAETEVAPEMRSLDWAQLAAIDPSDHCALRFVLDPAVRLVSSRFPVLSIWQAHAAEPVAPVDLAAGAEHVLVTRHDGSAALFRLDAGTFAFALSLADGESLADAHDAALAANERFDAGSALGSLVSAGVLVDVRLPLREVA